MNKILERERFISAVSASIDDEESVGSAFAKRLRAAIGDQPVLRFAQKCGMSDSLVRKYLEGSLPGLEKLIMLARAAEVRVGWLATGEPPVREGNGAERGLPVGATGGPLFGGFELIPCYDAQMNAGEVVMVNDEGCPAERLAFRRDWLLEGGFSPETLVMVVAGGDSMSPTIADGDLLLVDTREQDVAEDGIYVIQLHRHVVAKRLQLDWKGGFWVRSDNPQYSDQHITGEEAGELRIVGRAVWIVRRV